MCWQGDTYMARISIRRSVNYYFAYFYGGDNAVFLRIAWTRSVPTLFSLAIIFIVAVEVVVELVQLTNTTSTTNQLRIRHSHYFTNWHISIAICRHWTEKPVGPNNYARELPNLEVMHCCWWLVCLAGSLKQQNWWEEHERNKFLKHKKRNLEHRKVNFNGGGAAEATEWLMNTR